MAFNPLSLLLGQQMAGLIPESTQGEDIVVTAPQGRPQAQQPNYEDAPSRDSITPRYVMQDDRIAPTREEMKEILPRQGMFGTKGTLRDILGTLGDAFLVQSGNKAVYAPRREQERQGDAMFGASQDPMQAAERLAAMGDVEGAQKLIEQTQRNQYQQGQLQSQDASRQDQANNRKEDNIARLVNLTARRLQIAGDDPEKVAYALELAAQDAARNGITLEDLGLNPDMSDSQRQVFAGGDMTVNQQVQVPFTERRVQATERNAASTERNAATAADRANTYRRTAGRNPPQTQDSERYINIMDKPEQERTAGERAWAQRYREGTDGGGRSGRNRRPVSPDGQSGPTRTINGRTFRLRP